MSKKSPKIETPEVKTAESAIPEAPKVETQAAPSEAIAAVAALAGQAQAATDGAKPFMEPKNEGEQSTRKKRVYRKNPSDPHWSGTSQTPTGGGSSEQAAPTPPPADYTELCKNTFKIASGVIVRGTQCPAAGLLPEEVDALAASWNKVIVRYAPAFLNSHAELLGAVVVTGVVGMRINSVLQAEVKRRKAEADARANVKTAPVDIETTARPLA